jgi:hypothetical protein
MVGRKAVLQGCVRGAGAGSPCIGEAFLPFVFSILFRHVSPGGSSCQCVCMV